MVAVDHLKFHVLPTGCSYLIYLINSTRPVGPNNLIDAVELTESNELAAAIEVIVLVKVSMQT